MDERGLAERLKEREKEVELLRREVERLRHALAARTGAVRDMLARRGLKVYREEPGDDLIRPRGSTKPGVDEFYRRMGRYSFRLFLRDVIKHQDGFRPEELVRYSSLPVVREYSGYLAEAGILEEYAPGEYNTAGKRYLSFGPTLEWYVAEVFRRELIADALWGVRFKGAEAGGDFDVLAAVEGRMIYAEVKSSPPKQIYDSEVSAFIKRACEFSADLSLFVMDTELRMKDKIVPMFLQALPGTPLAGSSVERFKDELFRVGRSLFIVNSRGGLAANIGFVLGWYLKRREDAG
jgi:hypothetical protein